MHPPSALDGLPFSAVRDAAIARFTTDGSNSSRSRPQPRSVTAAALAGEMNSQQQEQQQHRQHHLLDQDFEEEQQLAAANADAALAAAACARLRHRRQREEEEEEEEDELLLETNANARGSSRRTGHALFGAGEGAAAACAVMRTEDSEEDEELLRQDAQLAFGGGGGGGGGGRASGDSRGGGAGGVSGSSQGEDEIVAELELRQQNLIENLIGMGFPVEWAIRASEHCDVTLNESLAIAWIIERMGEENAKLDEEHFGQQLHYCDDADEYEQDETDVGDTPGAAQAALRAADADRDALDEYYHRCSSQAAQQAQQAQGAATATAGDTDANTHTQNLRQSRDDHPRGGSPRPPPRLGELFERANGGTALEIDVDDSCNAVSGLRDGDDWGHDSLYEQTPMPRQNRSAASSFQNSRYICVGE